MAAYEEKKPHEWKEDFINVIDEMVAAGQITRSEAEFLEDTFRSMYHYVIKCKTPAYNKFNRIVRDFHNVLISIEETGGISLAQYATLVDAFDAVAEYVYNRRSVMPNDI